MLWILKVIGCVLHSVTRVQLELGCFDGFFLHIRLRKSTLEDKTRPALIGSRTQRKWDRVLCVPLPTVLGVMAYSVDPGVVNTEISRHMMRPIGELVKTFGFLIKSPAEGAYTSIYCIVTPENQMLTGGYYKSVWCAVEVSRSAWNLHVQKKNLLLHLFLVLFPLQGLCHCRELQGRSGRRQRLKAVGCELPPARHLLEINAHTSTGSSTRAAREATCTSTTNTMQMLCLVTAYTVMYVMDGKLCK